MHRTSSQDKNVTASNLCSLHKGINPRPHHSPSKRTWTTEYKVLLHYRSQLMFLLLSLRCASMSGPENSLIEWIKFIDRKLFAFLFPSASGNTNKFPMTIHEEKKYEKSSEGWTARISLPRCNTRRRTSWGTFFFGCNFYSIFCSVPL